MQEILISLDNTSPINSACRHYVVILYSPPTSSAYYIMARVERKKLLMMVDSGCSQSIISRLGLKRIPESSYTKPIKVIGSGILADGSRSPLSGSTMIEFELDSKIFRHRFLIGDITNHVLLGLDFMEENHCMLDFTNATLNFEDLIVACCTVDGEPLNPNAISESMKRKTTKRCVGVGLYMQLNCSRILLTANATATLLEAFNGANRGKYF